MEITVSIANILYLATAITVVAAAVKILLEAKKALTKPLDEIEEKFKSYDDKLDKDKKHLDKIDMTIEELGEAVNLMVSSHKVVLLHMKTGNNTGEIDREIKAIDEWLVQRKDYKL